MSLKSIQSGWTVSKNPILNTKADYDEYEKTIRARLAAAGYLYLIDESAEDKTQIKQEETVPKAQTNAFAYMIIAAEIGRNYYWLTDGVLNDPVQLWNKIQGVFEHKSAANLASYMEKLGMVKMNGSQSDEVDRVASEIKRLCRMLKKQDVEIPTTAQLALLYKSLSSELRPCLPIIDQKAKNGQLLDWGETLNVIRNYAVQIIQDEKTERSGTAKAYSAINQTSRPKCAICNYRNHTTEQHDDSKLSARKKKNLAKKKKKLEKLERKSLIAEISQAVFEKFAQDEKAADREAHVAFTAESPHNTEFYLDSGADDHYISNPSVIDCLSPTSNEVSVGNGAKLPIEGTGLMDACDDFNIPLYSVSYTPGMKTNLVSVGRLADNGYICVFDHEECRIYDYRDIQIIGKPTQVVTRSAGMYKFNIGEAATVKKSLPSGPMKNGLSTFESKNLTVGHSTKHSTNSSLKVIIPSTTESRGLSTSGSGTGHCDNSSNRSLLHKRLGHVSDATIRKAIEKEIISVCDTKSKPGCVPCAVGKSKRSPFPKKASRGPDALNLLDVVAMDVGGPFPPTLSRSKWFTLYIDLSSRYVYLVTMKAKSEGLKKLQEYVKYAERHTGRKIKIIRSDNAGEYLSRSMEAYLTLMGITHELTAPYTPQHNGVAERWIGIIGGQAKTMMVNAYAPDFLWAESYHTAEHITNRLPTSALPNGETPFGRWNPGRQPDLSYAKVFGCVAYVHIPKPLQRKFKDKSQLAVFVGYPRHSKGYRFFDPTSHKFYVRRDAVFLEDTFFYKPTGPRTDAPLLNEADDNDDDDVIYTVPTPQADTDLPSEVEPIIIEEPDQELVTVLEPVSEIDLQPINQEVDHNSPNDEREVGRRTSLRENRGVPPVTMNYTGLGRPESHRYANASSVGDISNIVPKVPRSFQEAMNSPEAANWKAAMDDEITSLESYQTWKLVPYPSNARVIGSMWVFAVKRDGRFKARLVALGNHQVKGRDYFNTSSPVSGLNSVRLFFSLCADLRLDMHQFDVPTAYLNGKLKEIVYMRQPRGYEQPGHWACLLLKSLYGLKQSGREWNEVFNQFLVAFGFKPLKSDPCVYILQKGDAILLLIIYVDDGLIGYNDADLIKLFLNALKRQYNIKDLGTPTNFLGINVSINRTSSSYSISLNQTDYIQKLLRDANMEDCKPSPSPATVSVKLGRPTEQEKKLVFNVPHQHFIGCINWLAGTTRYDIANATINVAQFANDFGSTHWTALKRILRYLKGTMNQSITYTGRDISEIGKVIVYSDSDWAGDVLTRKSTSGRILFTSGPICWKSQKQKCVAHSSNEAEYISASETGRDIKWMANFCSEIGYSLTRPTVIYVDNQSAIQTANNRLISGRSKHIDLRYHFIRDEIAAGNIALKWIETTENLADLMTKPLPNATFVRLRDAILKMGTATPAE